LGVTTLLADTLQFVSLGFFGCFYSSPPGKAKWDGEAWALQQELKEWQLI